MSGTLRPVLQKLYLCKGKDEDDDENLFVESTLHQHHIDGIRFLYKQFKKNKPGVVLNNPLGYGNSLQVALFLGAVRHLLKNPILILCEEGEEYNWFEHFQKLTQCYNDNNSKDNDFSINAPTPTGKKSIFINNEWAKSFTGRRWGALVVDNDAFLKAKSLHPKFQADFKIWITPVDMKEDLKTLTSIYKWIYPNEKFNADEFKSTPGDRNDAISKSIQLQTYLEDTVFRTTLLTPFENPYEKKVLSSEKVTKKNKDATGTKIKRSKRIAEEMTSDNTDEQNEPHVSAVKVLKLNNAKTVINTNRPSVSNIISNYKTQSFNRNGEPMEIDNINSDLDNETFVSNKEPNIGDTLENSHDFDNISNESQEGKLVLHYESDTMLNEIERINCFKDSVTVSETSLSKTLGQTLEMSPESDDYAYQLETQELLNDKDGNEVQNDNYFNNELNKKEKCVPKIEVRYINPWVDKTKSLECKQTELENNDNNINIENELNDMSHGVIVDKDASLEPDMRKVRDKDELIKINNNSEIDNENVSKTEELQNDNKSKEADIDSKLTEHEDRIFKKFKGTFLDKIF